MHISFNGALSYYTYNCPYAHWLKNVKRAPTRLETDEPEDACSKRIIGIESHDLISQYLQGEEVEISFITDTILNAKDVGTHFEHQMYLNTDYQLLQGKPTDGHFISLRPDAMALGDEGIIWDWKFGNSDFGAPRYYDEVEFFLAMVSLVYPDIGQWKIIIHFPFDDYTLPIREYSAYQCSALQQLYMHRIDLLLNTKIFKPIPAKSRCRFCSFRSEDTGGTEQCEHSLQ